MWRGGPFGGPGWGPHRRGRGRARRGDVRFALLRRLAEEPRNGYQLIQAIEERSEGLWRPSPGSVYPTLAQLEDEGLIRSVEADGARRFEVTDAGREQVERRGDEPNPWEASDEDADNPLSELAPLVIQIGKATFQVASVGDRAQREQARALLQDTRRALYRILADDAHATGVDEDEREV
jgi:DNA-binding PadR family transcriptional regulator